MATGTQKPLEKQAQLQEGPWLTVEGGVGFGPQVQQQSPSPSNTLKTSSMCYQVHSKRAVPGHSTTSSSREFRFCCVHASVIKF